MLTRAEIVESILHDANFYADGCDSFSLGCALLFSVNQTDDGLSITKAGEHGDVYDLLDTYDSRKVAQVSDFIVVATTGWAAPIDENTEEGVPPSQHAERRRVRLMVFANREQTVSVLRFSDTPEETITDEGKATGSLADAVRALFV